MDINMISSGSPITEITDTNGASVGSTDHRDLSRKLNPENELFFIPGVLLLKGRVAAAEQHVGSRSRTSSRLLHTTLPLLPAILPVSQTRQSRLQTADSMATPVLPSPQEGEENKWKHLGVLCSGPGLLAKRQH